MVRAPYPARIAAGLIVTAIEETRKLPTLLFTLPMTAISQTLQAGMRAQQGIAELAIKGDEALDAIFDRPTEEPAWARFDEDDIDPTEAAALPIESAAVAPATKTAAPKTAAPKTAATKAPSKKASSKTSPATTKAAAAPPAPTASDEAAAPRADAGRFALYSSAPDEVIAAISEPAPSAKAQQNSVPAPEIVEYIEYPNLTLAQLRAKLRSVSTDDLAELLAYEKAGRNRAPFVTMLDNRITAAENKRPPTA